MIKLLVVDDSALMRRLMATLFGAEADFTVWVARDGVEALAQVEAVRPDVVTLDVAMPRMDGIACLDAIMLARPCPVVMVSAFTQADAALTLEALGRGAVDVVAKPEGAISLSFDALGPALVARVRAAAGARVRLAPRLAERVRRQAGGAVRDGVPARRPAGEAAPPPNPAAFNRCVLIGTSTGGPPALDEVLSGLPGGFPCPVVVAQHMPVSFTGPLARRLDALCVLEVVEVTGPMPLRPGRVYVGRGDADVIVATRPNGPVVMAAPSSPAHRWHPSVERLVASAAEHLGPARLIGVLLTGMGNDGAGAMTRLRAAGGRTIAEAADTAVVWGMPGELVRAGGAEAVLPLGAIASRLVEWAA